MIENESTKAVKTKRQEQTKLLGSNHSVVSQTVLFKEVALVYSENNGFYWDHSVVLSQTLAPAVTLTDLSSNDQ